MEELLAALQEKIGYRFLAASLLQEALTHKSFSNEMSAGIAPCNERLEFLGDAVLDLVVGAAAFVAYPDLPEGELTRMRAELVNEKSLAGIARQLDLGPCLRLGRGERRSGGAGKDSLLADVIEALFGAVFLDGGFAAASQVIEALFCPLLDLAARRQYDLDFKTLLQEVCQKRYGRTPEYFPLQVTGPDHDPSYVVEVRVDGESRGRGEGRTKKAAEQQAAAAAYARFAE
jgi:ribonuclease-3